MQQTQPTGPRFTPSTVRLCTFAWSWIATCAPDLHTTVLAHVFRTFSSTTTQRRLGLFYHSPTPSRTQAAYQLEAHSVLLHLLNELWHAQPRASHAHIEATRDLYTRALATALASFELLSPHPLAAGPLARLLSLTFAVADSFHVASKVPG